MTTFTEIEHHRVIRQNFELWPMPHAQWQVLRFAIPPQNEATAERAGALAVRGTRPLNYNHFKIRLMENA